MSFLMIYDIVFLLVGCYGLSICAKVGMSGDLEDIKILLPRNAKPDECLDPAAFLTRVRPWMIVFSASIVLNGAAGMLEDMKLGLPHVVHMATLGVCIAAAGAYFAIQHRAVKEFWDLEDPEESK